MVALKFNKLPVNQESILLQPKEDPRNICFPIASCYFKNADFEIIDVKLLNKDTCQEFRTTKQGSEHYILNFFSTERVAKNTELHPKG